MIVVVGRYGRLGNRIWTFANVLAWAIERRIAIANPAFEPFTNFFDRPIVLTANVLSSTSLIGPRRRAEAVVSRALDLAYRVNLRTKVFPNILIGETARLMLDDDPLATTLLGTSRMAFMSGFYFCAPRSLEKQKATVKRYFTPRENIKKRVDKLVARAREYGEPVIGIHMRQGDYKDFCNGIMFYSTEEYVNVMHCLAEQTSGRRAVFLVVSDEPHHESEFPGLSVILAQGNAAEDMYALAGCDFILGPNSSFSQWSSFYGEVPLHVLDWRTAIAYKRSNPIFAPSLTEHFAPIRPTDFYKYSSQEAHLFDAA